MHYWYFTYYLSVPATGYEKKSDGVIASWGHHFPIGNVRSMLTEAMDEDDGVIHSVEITILNSMLITKKDFIALSEELVEEVE